MRVLLAFFLVCYSSTLIGQTTIKGQIKPSANFRTKLYILKHNYIDPHPPELYDSIEIRPDGSFYYAFPKTSPQDLLYKLHLPVKDGSRFSTYGTLQKNFVYISTESGKAVTLYGFADSLFYSSKYSGPATSGIQWFTDLQKPFYNLEKTLVDSIHKNPTREQEYKQRLMPVWMKTVEQLKPKILAALDTAKSSTSILLGLQLLFEANFGKLDSATTEKYLAKITNQDLILVRTTRELSRAKRSDRKDILLPNVQLISASGKKKNLYDFKSEYLLIDFWASWCSPCRYANRNELPQLNKEFNDQVELLGITIDIDTKKWKTAVLKDNTSWGQFIDKDYLLKKTLDIQAVPVYLLLDRNHKVIFETISVYQMHEYLTKKLAPK